MGIQMRRVIELNSDGFYVKTKDRQLIFSSGEAVKETVPLEDLGCLIIDSRGSSISSAALSALVDANTLVLITDVRHMPAGVLLPIDGHSLQVQRLNAQINLSMCKKKQLWQQIVKAKICNQSVVAEIAAGARHEIYPLKDKVLSNDSSNVEAQAAKRYWKAIRPTQ